MWHPMDFSEVICVSEGFMGMCLPASTAVLCRAWSGFLGRPLLPAMLSVQADSTLQLQPLLVNAEQEHALPCHPICVPC